MINNSFMNSGDIELSESNQWLTRIQIIVTYSPNYLGKSKGQVLILIIIHYLMDLLGRLWGYQYKYGLPFKIGQMEWYPHLQCPLWLGLSLSHGLDCWGSFIKLLVNIPCNIPTCFDVTLAHPSPIVANRATGSFSIVANTLTQLEIYSIVSGQAGPGLWLIHCTPWQCNCVEEFSSVTGRV